MAVIPPPKPPHVTLLPTPPYLCEREIKDRAVGMPPTLALAIHRDAPNPSLAIHKDAPNPSPDTGVPPILLKMDVESAEVGRG